MGKKNIKLSKARVLPSDKELQRDSRSTEYLASRRSRREFLAELGNLTASGLAAFGVLGLPGRLNGMGASADSLAEGLYPSGPMKRESGDDYPACPPFDEYADGGYCTPTYNCGTSGSDWSFHCTGGMDDDYECATFTCEPQFTCGNGFDAADCDTVFACDTTDEFGCFDDFDARGCEPTQRFRCHPGLSDPYRCNPTGDYTY